jgi:hydroxypyruvate isomerase
LIEPLNHRDAPGYFLRTLGQALDVVDRAAIGRLRIMFDCYHMQIEGGDLLRRFEAHGQHIGHVQFASVPDRTEPDEGEVAYERLLPALVDAGYGGWFGAEYRPRVDTRAGLGWLGRF